MGSVGGGNTNTRNTSEAPKYDNAYWSASGSYNHEDYKSTAELIERYVKDSNWKDNMRKDLSLTDATDEQLWALRTIFQGIQEYDKGYDDNKTPYKIASFDVEMLGEKVSEERKAELRSYGLRATKQPIMVSIRTVPDINSAYLRMTDEKERRVLIGPRGGYFKYSESPRSGKTSQQTVRPFDVRYGKRPYYENTKTGR